MEMLVRRRDPVDLRALLPRFWLGRFGPALRERLAERGEAREGVGRAGFAREPLVPAARRGGLAGLLVRLARPAALAAFDAARLRVPELRFG
jgi:hypothetical protein